MTIVFLLLLFSGKAASPSDTIPGNKKSPVFDTNYIADYTASLTTRLYLLRQNATLLLNPVNADVDKIVYRPNVNVRIGIAGFWRWFGLGIAVDNPFYKSNTETFGKTTTIDLRVTAFGRKFVGELFLQKYKGFYIASPARENGANYTLPDMSTFSVGASGYWIYNHRRFSIRAAFIQNEQQKKSAGSFVVRPALLFYQIVSDSGIIPGEVANTYRIPVASLISKGDFYSLGLSPGYAYTLVFLRNFYITAAVFPGIAAHYYSFSNETGRYTNFELAFQLNGRFALGYNSDNWFLGGSFMSGFNEIPDQLSQAIFSYEIAQFRFWGGMRFDFFKRKSCK